MLAVITGASSGLGKEFAKQLDSLGCDTVIVARREDRLNELKSQLKNNCAVFCADLSDSQKCRELFASFPDADILINNAGFGTFGEIAESDLDRDEEMIAINVNAQYVLMERFKKKRHGYILNTASAAAFMAGPYFGLYYATKAFVLRVSQAASREAKEYGVCVSAFCPGSVATEFNSIAKTTSSSKPLTPELAVKYAINKMFKGKPIIIPSAKIRAAFVMSKLMPEHLLTEFSCHVQKKRF